MTKSTDIKVDNVSITFIPIKTRIPLKFGTETLLSVTCARVKLSGSNRKGESACGLGETPLSVQWVWPSRLLSYNERHELLKKFCLQLVEAWLKFDKSGHAMEIGHHFQKEILQPLLQEFNQTESLSEPMPWLAALVCCSAFDLALHDLYGMINQLPVYQTYNSKYMNHDLSYFITPAADANISFSGQYPEDYFVKRPDKLPAWHLVGGKDLLEADELTGQEPDDGYPVLLRDWIRTDGLKCLKVKLRGNDFNWDYDRITKVGKIAIEEKVNWLTTDFNCTVTDPGYVNDILDRLIVESPRIYGMILYVEQPFPYDLEKNQIDVHSVSARKPLFMDESCHDWTLIKLGRKLGWTGVALKTCKTHTGALLSLCWAKAHGMTVMVQDLTNPKLAQIPHCLLAAYAGTIMGVETNAMQFYPDASKEEAAIHPGLYRRRNGMVDISTIHGAGFGYGIN